MSVRPTSRRPTRDSWWGSPPQWAFPPTTTSRFGLTLGEPVDYVAIGPVFPTASKDRPDPVVGLDGVRRARDIVASSGRPLVAIGGITLERARSVIDAGADSIAVIADLVAGEPGARARAFLRAVQEP